VLLQAAAHVAAVDLLGLLQLLAGRLVVPADHDDALLRDLDLVDVPAHLVAAPLQRVGSQNRSVLKSLSILFRHSIDQRRKVARIQTQNQSRTGQ